MHLLYLVVLQGSLEGILLSAALQLLVVCLLEGVENISVL